MRTWQEQAQAILATQGIAVASVESQDTVEYNCIAWAAGFQTIRWWPHPNPGWFWPRPISGADSLAEFVAAFGLLGYQVCQDGSLDADFEKIALYGDVDHIKHAARQLADGRWTSKLGVRGWDVFHTLEQLEDTQAPRLGYGLVVAFMCRPR